MAVNYAEKYSAKVDEAFKLASVTERAVNQEYDWDGVSTVYVYGMETVAMNDYTMTGSSRYGNPAELGNTKQALTISKDRSFTYTIDRKNYTDTMMTMEAGRSLRRQIDMVVTPEIDKYRIRRICDGRAADSEAYKVLSKSNAYEQLLFGSETLGNAKAPVDGRICYCTYGTYGLFKQDPAFIRSGDVSQEMLVKGQLGTIDGIAIVPIPADYFPQDVAFLITHSIATTAPMKLVDYKIHDNPPGINGWLVEGRVIYDAFVLNQKKPAIYVHYNLASKPA